MLVPTLLKKRDKRQKEEKSHKITIRDRRIPRMEEAHAWHLNGQNRLDLPAVADQRKPKQKERGGSRRDAKKATLKKNARKPDSLPNFSWSRSDILQIQYVLRIPVPEKKKEDTAY